MLQFICLIILGFMFGCGGQGSGVAPSAPAPPAISIVIDNQSVLKYGQQVSSINGWNVSIDHSDPVETVNLANGWTVEVLHE